MTPAHTDEILVAQGHATNCPSRLALLTVLTKGVRAPEALGQLLTEPVEALRHGTDALRIREDKPDAAEFLPTWNELRGDLTEKAPENAIVPGEGWELWKADRS